MLKYCLVSIFSLFLSSSGAFAQSADPAWLEDLNFEIAAEKQCEITYIVRMQEGVLGGQPTYEARVQCEDGRMFDASRIGEVAPFTFALCEIQVC
ncbi:MAG: hypothetical protein AAF362_17395 [Pseudomonadota bacterium]